MKIAIIGAGISGLTTAYALSAEHEIWVYESEDRTGGHTQTIDVSSGGKVWPVNTGFIVFNRRTYPEFVKLMQRLGVKWQNSDMSFGIKCTRSGLEFSPSNLKGLFGCLKNLATPSLWRLPMEILRFRRLSMSALRDDFAADLTLAEFLKTNNFSSFFREYFLLPMGAAIWSADPKTFDMIPLQFFARFFANHGFLDIDQPQWLTLINGSRSYLEPLTQSFKNNILLSSPVTSVKRFEDRVEISTNGCTKSFDQVVIACHSDQALTMLKDACSSEKEILAAVPYQKNDVVLHTDSSILPCRKAAWASWNYLLPAERDRLMLLTYHMNKLQNLAASEDFCVSLNSDGMLAHEKVIARLCYSHPVFTIAGIDAQKRWSEINGVRRTWFAGAWWRYGFHEDGVQSGLRVARALGSKL